MIVTLRQKNPDNLNEWITKEIYLDETLKCNLDLGIELQHKDFDSIWFIDGGEGTGKTTLAIPLAYYVSPEERRHNLLDRVCINVDSADKVILESQQYDSIIIDEGYGGMASVGFMSKINRLLQRRFTEIRAKNLFVFIIAPSFMDINRYFAVWRSKCLLHVYAKGKERGRACFFDEWKKRKLYILGKQQFYNYNCVPANFVFKFTDQLGTVIDKVAYIEKKRKANLEKEEEKVLSEDDFKKEFIKKVLINNSKSESPLTQDQLGNVLGVSDRQIRRYNRDLLDN